MQKFAILTLVVTGLWVAAFGLPDRVAIAWQESEATDEGDEAPLQPEVEFDPELLNPPIDPEVAAEATSLLEQARDRLYAHESVEAVMVERAAFGSRRFRAEGTYQAGIFPQLRLEYRIRVGESEGVVREVCDGFILRTTKYIRAVDSDPGEIDPGVAYRVSDLELASRLSFFLWSSIPDDELLRLAEHGRLRDPAVFDAQARRMLADDRAAALIKSFGAQWLYLRNMQIAAPDLYEFPEWDDNLRVALTQETELFLEHQLREDRSVTELLTADYTFLNERLARHYGVPDVYGSHFRSLQPVGPGRAGILMSHDDAHAAVRCQRGVVFVQVDAVVAVVQ